MKFRLFKSLRTKILLSFFAFILILLFWIAIFISTSGEQVQLQSFSNRLTLIQNRFLESNRNLQYFLLSGYHYPGFYQNYEQPDIDSFLAYQAQTIRTLKVYEKDSKKNKINLSRAVAGLMGLHSRLFDSVKAIKQVYYEKGFKDFGTEGRMRHYAHLLEDSSLIPEVKLLQLRRHEKDYLIRGDLTYADQFDSLIQRLITGYRVGSPQYRILGYYKSYFSRIVVYTNRLGINTNTGLFNEVQNLTVELNKSYSDCRNYTEQEISRLQHNSIGYLFGVSVLLVILVISLSLYFSSILTRDIKLLNRRMFAYINSGFKDDKESDDGYAPRITEIDRLNRDFNLLKKSLKSTLINLENSFQKAQQSSEYKSTFLANMSHEIRTPLNGITGMVHLLKGLDITEEQQDYVNTIDFSANHLLELINMILDYSKIEAGKMELELIEFDLKGDIKKLVKIFEFKLAEKGLQFELQLPDDMSRYIYGDQLRLQQVLINLINNAIKFTTAGKITFRISQIRASANEQTLLFEVEDTGIGINAEQKATLFEAFKQADTSISRNFGGTGLGLTISNQLVKLMGGSLLLNSTMGVGTKIYFELTFKRAGKILYTHDIQTAAKVKIGPHILLAEDNVVNQKVLTLMLKKSGASIDVAQNGKEAVSMYEEGDYDIVLMDIRMPVMDGLEATGRIIESEKHKFRNTPIIAITANAFNEDRKIAFDAGMNDFLSKPIKPLELEGILAKYFLKLYENA